MAEGSRPSDDGGVRRRRSGEHDDLEGEIGMGRDGVQTGVRTVNSDGEPVTQTTATDIPASPRSTTSRDFERAPAPAGDVERKKRKSDEISRDAGDASTSATGMGGKNASRQPLSIDVRAAMEQSSQDASRNGRSVVSSPTQLSPTSPTSPRSRNRGMSLRTSLFTRNVERRSPIAESSIELHRVETIPSKSDPSNTNSRPGTAKTEPRTSITVTPLPDRSSSPPPDRIPTHGAIKLTTPDILTRSSLRSKSRFRGISALPNYQKWVQERAQRHLPIQRCRNVYERARKYILQIQEIPPSKDGRHIPLDPARKKALVDERTGHQYISNFIKSSKYTPWNFLPRQLFAQFSKLANLYFLTVATLQMVPGLSTTGTYTTIVPLMFFVSISMAKEGFEDVRRHRLDKEENNRVARVLHAYRPVGSEGEDAAKMEAAEGGLVHWADVKWQALQVGDIIRLERDEPAPADILLLDSKGANNLAYIETMALDGETNLKTKQPSGLLVGACGTPEAIAALEKAEAVVEDPNMDLYNFEGKVEVAGELAPLGSNEVVYRGSILRNTPEVTGVVVYSGEECKIRMNANKNPRVKAPSLQWTVNRIVMCMVVFVVSLAVLCTILYQVWHFDFEQHAWYISSARVPFGHIIVSFIIMFNTMIPLSLYVSLEIIKVAQIWLMNDIDMYDEASNTPFEARTSTINEELGQVSYIFSDKTGTLTENVMRFRKMSVAGVAALHDADLKDQPREEMLLHKKRNFKGKRPIYKGLRKSATHSSFTPSRNNSHMEIDPSPRKSTATWTSAVKGVAQPELSTAELIRYIQRHPQTAFARKMRTMVLAMALCHTCLPEHGKDENDVSYQAASPDELALVQAAREMGYFAFDREVYKLTLKTYPNGFESDAVVEQYEILDVIEFSSKRKRMSVVVRLPDARICIVCKGADSVITERLRLATLANQKISEIEKHLFERRSLEAEEAIRRKRSMNERQSSVSSLPRNSVSRVSFGRPSIGRLAPIRDEVDGWLRDREQDVVLPAERSHYTPRPSAQLPRKSAAVSEYSLPSEFDASPLVEESLVLDDAAVIERCFQHVNDFATEGLRTLLYAHRFLDEEDYRSWKKVYTDATTSLTDRQVMIEAAGELIERNLELTGATAIEDKLQSGVPETIERLRRANIKLWMLTGDKRETAINIGHSCRLIKDYSSVTILDYEAGKVEERIAAAIVDIDLAKVAHSVVIIDGHTLGMIQTDASLHELFLVLAVAADSVICCRASPSQKAHLVHAIRRRVNRSVTLAIGDGANDIAMIQEAHVGIGITGKEGLQAARSSDYSIAQFRFLNKLLLVHGRWNYVRTCKYVLATFWKEMLFYLTQALYQRSNGYTGTSLYEQWSLSQFNTLFTSLPVILLGALEKDLSPATLLAVPELYNKGQRFAGFNFKVYISWMFMAASEAMVVYFTMQKLFGLALTNSGDDLYAMGDMTFTACIIIINCKLQLLEQRNRTFVAPLILFIEIGGYFLWTIIFSAMYGNNFVYDVKGGFLSRFGANPAWWIVLVLIVASCLLFEITVRTLKNFFAPTDVEIFQELERDLAVRRRFEEASASELQAGWLHAGGKSSLEVRREAEEQAKREGEVQDLLDRPRVMEEGGGRKKSGVVQREEMVVMVEDGETGAGRRSTDIQEMLSRRFGTVRRGELREIGGGA